MSTLGRPKTPWHLWVVGFVSLLWHAGGAYDYTMTQSRDMDYLTMSADGAGMPVDTMVAYYEGFPIWADICWAFGVWGAVAGSLLLLLRSRFAFHAFVVSLIGLVGTSLYTFTGSMPPELQSNFTYIFTAVVFATTILLAWYARRMTTRGVLR